MVLPGTNLDGLIVFGVGFGTAIGVEALVGNPGEGPLTMIGGAIVAVLGFVLSRARNGDPQNPDPVGSRVLFVLAWVAGIFWIALGAYYAIRA